MEDYQESPLTSDVPEVTGVTETDLTSVALTDVDPVVEELQILNNTTGIIATLLLVIVLFGAITWLSNHFKSLIF